MADICYDGTSSARSRKPMKYEFLKLDLDEPVTTLTLDRQPGNQLNVEMLDEMNDALLSLRNRPQLEVLVLRGAGGQFCEGLDLNEHRKSRVQRLFQVYTRFFETLRMLEVVSIAAVEGRAWGAGFEVTLGCDLVVASDDASFCLPETSQGLFPPIASIMLPRLVGRRRAMEWILTGSEITADQLGHYGMINCVLMSAHFERELAEYIERISAKSGPVLQLARKAQLGTFDASYSEAVSRVQSLYLRDLLGLSDSAEGLRALQEGREPIWRNE
jgi:enoyl-CoA hydratase/carnithine racemase